MLVQVFSRETKRLLLIVPSKFQRDLSDFALQAHGAILQLLSYCVQSGFLSSNAGLQGDGEWEGKEGAGGQ